MSTMLKLLNRKRDVPPTNAEPARVVKKKVSYSSDSDGSVEYGQMIITTANETSSDNESKGSESTDSSSSDTSSEESDEKLVEPARLVKKVSFQIEHEVALESSEESSSEEDSSTIYSESDTTESASSSSSEENESSSVDSSDDDSSDVKSKSVSDNGLANPDVLIPVNDTDIGHLHPMDIDAVEYEMQSTMLSRMDSFESRQSDNSVDSSSSSIAQAEHEESKSSSSDSSSSDEQNGNVPNVPQEKAKEVLARVLNEFRSQQRTFHEMCLRFIAYGLKTPAPPKPPSIKSLCRRLVTVPPFSAGHSNFCEHVVLGDKVVWVLCLPQLPSCKTVGEFLEGLDANPNSKELVVYSVGNHDIKETVDVSPSDVICDLSIFTTSRIFCIARLSVTQSRPSSNRAKPQRSEIMDENEALARVADGSAPGSYMSHGKHKGQYKKVTDQGYMLAVRHLLAGTHRARIDDPHRLQVAAQQLLDGDVPDVVLSLHADNAKAFADAMESTEIPGHDQNKVFRKLVRYSIREGVSNVFGKGNAVAEWTASNMVYSLYRTLLFLEGKDNCGIVYLKKARITDSN